MIRSGKIIMLVLLAALVSCVQSGRRGSSEAETAVKVRKFPMAAPPAMMQDRQEIAEYMAMHYWDGLCAHLTGSSEAAETYLCDSLHVSGVPSGDFEQSMANYIYILESLPLEKAQKAVAYMADLVMASEKTDTTSNIFERMVQVTEKYMYDPNSPLRNEDLYSPFAAKLAQYPSYSQEERDRYAFVAKMCRLNEKGTKAADFRFCDRYGRNYTLYGTDAEFTLLFFSNPGCVSCLEIINMLKSEPSVNQMIAQKRLKVLNIYIDEDLQAWKEYMHIYPEEWYNGFDPDLIIRNDRTYSVRAIPSLYLLDKDKKVIMKDAVPERLIPAIAANS